MFRTHILRRQISQVIIIHRVYQDNIRTNTKYVELIICTTINLSHTIYLTHTVHSHSLTELLTTVLTTVNYSHPVLVRLENPVSIFPLNKHNGRVWSGISSVAFITVFNTPWKERRTKWMDWEDLFPVIALVKFLISFQIKFSAGNNNASGHVRVIHPRYDLRWLLREELMSETREERAETLPTHRLRRLVL